MNERIKEFAHRCGFTEYRGDDGCDDESLTKFAELIIRECAEQSMLIGKYNTPNGVTPDLSIAISVGLKKHFGVDMSTHITKIWFDGEKVVTQEIPEADIYLPDTRWDIKSCAAYAEQLRDKTRANTAQHAAEAIEYLLTLAQREWVGLTDDDLTFWGHELGLGELGMGVLRAVDAHLREKNT